MNALAQIRPAAPTLSDLASAVLAADDAWEAAYEARDNEALAGADDALIAVRAELWGAFMAEAGVSREALGKLGVVL